jgi:hypothetical protein
VIQQVTQFSVRVFLRKQTRYESRSVFMVVFSLFSMGDKTKKPVNQRFTGFLMLFDNVASGERGICTFPIID